MYEGVGAVGLYYNFSKYHDLFLESLEKSLSDAVIDISEVIK